MLLHNLNRSIKNIKSKYKLETHVTRIFRETLHLVHLEFISNKMKNRNENCTEYQAMFEDLRTTFEIINRNRELKKPI